MSLITRCPACGTMFKVVTDQLKVSQGWVRCGHCTEVFDASLHFQAAQDRLAPSPDTPSARRTGTETKTPEAPEAPAESVLPLASVPPMEPLLPLEAKPLPAVPALARPVSQAPHALPDDEVSFVRDSRRQAFWRRPVVRAVLGLSALLLAALLLVQWSVQHRHRLVAMAPQLKPWLQMLCEPLQCDTAPLRHIEAVVIDSSSFSKIDSDSYRLSFTLKNTGATPVAMPSLEVSITDSQEQAVIRRVVPPAQFGVADGTGVLGAGSDFSGVVVMQVLAADTPGAVGQAAPAGGPLRVAGYRVLAFYP